MRRPDDDRVIRPRQARPDDYVPPPGLERKPDEPDTPDLAELGPVPRAMKAELKTLSKEHADIVAAHLLAAASLIDDDPDLAFRHAEAAKRRAARLPVVREAAAETAYAAGRFEEALSEFRALRRMNGSPDYLPVLADCERALGRHQAALRLVAEGEQAIKDPGLLVELRLVQAGVRADLGQRDEALRLLRTELESPQHPAPKDSQARLRYAYADLLLAGGDEAGARDWFSAAVRLDPEGQTDALDRLDELDGMVLTLDEDDLDDDETVQPAAVESSAEEPAAEEPPAEQPPADEPKAEELFGDQPPAEEPPAPQQIAIASPGTDLQPVTEVEEPLAPALKPKRTRTKPDRAAELPAARVPADLAEETATAPATEPEQAEDRPEEAATE